MPAAACAPEEWHEGSLLILGVLLRRKAWPVAYLGQNVPFPDLAEGHVTPAWRDFMRFQIERARNLYTSSWSGIKLLDRTGRLAIGAAAVFYSGILDDIERHDYDVFTRRSHLTAWEKICRIPALWLRVIRM